MTENWGSIPEREPERWLLLPRKAAGAKIAKPTKLEAVTINICGLYESDWNEMDLKNPTSINWRKSLVPAPAVIPAPRAYIQVAAVKKLVVGWGIMGRR